MRKIDKIVIDIEDPETGETLFTFATQDTEVILPGENQEDLEREMKKYRKKLRDGINIYFPHYEDRITKHETKAHGSN